jgi:hypothetical protein
MAMQKFKALIPAAGKLLISPPLFMVFKYDLQVGLK